MARSEKQDATTSYDVLILGAGYAGMIAALRLRRKGLRLALVNASDEFIERVRLQESIAAAVPARIASITCFLSGTGIDFITGQIVSLDTEARQVRLLSEEGEREIGFEQALYALGSNTELDKVPGVPEHAYRLESIGGQRSPSALRSALREGAGKALSVIAVGGAETSIEVAGEIKTTWPAVNLTLISKSRAGSFKGQAVEAAVRGQLTSLGVQFVDGETIVSVGPTELVTANGMTIPFDICVWSGGLRAPPIAHAAGIATDTSGRILVDGDLRSISHPCILAAGDAARPIAPTGAPYRMSAFAALASGAHAADVIARRGPGGLRPFCFSTIGQGIAIGRRGVGFITYPDDKQSTLIVSGPLARAIRNLFVWYAYYTLRLERRFPGLFWWPGRLRVSRQQADTALQAAQCDRSERVA
jgi:NADH:quinone reductase (non-electrogenic)